MHSSPARSLPRARRILTAAALAVVALPAAAAHAAEVTAVGTEIAVHDNGGRFRQGIEENRIVAEALPGGELRLADGVPLVSKTDTCVNVTQLEVRCIRPSTSPISKLTVRAGDRDDQLRVAGSLPIDYVGGGGDDLYVGARTAAPTRVDFQGGNDAGDLAHYANAQTGVHVSKDEVANDGRPGVNDRDNIRNDVNVVTGTRFDDRLSGVVGIADSEEFRPLAGNDLVIGADAFFTLVDMGAAKDGADKIVAGRATEVSYANRANAIRAAVDLGGADDGEAGERDELVGVQSVVGGSGDDTMFAADRPGSVGVALSGGLGADRITGTNLRDRLTGGPGRDILGGKGGNDELIADDGDVDHVFCGDGNSDTARTDTAELTLSGCETRITP
jgi:hypothetical protein